MTIFLSSTPACKKVHCNTAGHNFIHPWYHVVKSLLTLVLFNLGPEPDPQSNTGRHRVKAGFEKSWKTWTAIGEETKVRFERVVTERAREEKNSVRGSVPGRERPIFGSKKCPKRVRITFVRTLKAMSDLTSQSLHIIRFAVQRLESPINENLRIG